MIRSWENDENATVSKLSSLAVGCLFTFTANSDSLFMRISGVEMKSAFGDVQIPVVDMMTGKVSGTSSDIEVYPMVADRLYVRMARP